MGDPTDQPKGSDDAQYQGDSSDSDIDVEAEEINPETAQQNVGSNSTGVETTSNNHGTNINYRRNPQNRANHNSNDQTTSDTVTSILASISNPDAAVVIPLEPSTSSGHSDEAEIDAERMERFYNGALTAITKVWH